MSDDARLSRAVLDTDVIYSRVLHELIGRLAYQERLLTLIWSDELLKEAKRILVERKPVPKQAAERWVDYMRQAYPDQRVKIDQLPAEVDLTTLTTDPGDHHICAPSIAGHADLLLTFDQGYISKSLAEHGIRVLTPDAFLDTTLQERVDGGSGRPSLRDPRRYSRIIG